KALPTHPVRGSAHFEGAPMAGASIMMTSDKERAPGKLLRTVGVVEADGSFKLSTYQAFDGAPAGEYKIAVSWLAAGTSLVPAHYTVAAKSGLRATIKAGTNDLV